MELRLILIAAILVPFALEAQPAPVDTAAKRKAMEKLAFIVGDWGGEASAFAGQGNQIRMWQTEWVRYKLKGQLLAVEGVGRRMMASGPGDTVFNAWATIDWTPERGYLMRSNVLDGRVGEYPVEVLDNGFNWGITVPAGRVRYMMRLTPAGEWHEVGEFSRDGTQWYPLMEMRLKKTRSTVP